MVRNILYTPLQTLIFLIQFNFRLNVWKKVGLERRSMYFSENIMGTNLHEYYFVIIVPLQGDILFRWVSMTENAYSIPTMKNQNFNIFHKTKQLVKSIVSKLETQWLECMVMQKDTSIN